MVLRSKPRFGTLQVRNDTGRLQQGT